MNVVRTSQLDDKFQTCLLNDKFETIEVPVNRKNISFALLKLKSNSFDEVKLISYLQNASVYYALPSKRIEELRVAIHPLADEIPGADRHRGRRRYRIYDGRPFGTHSRRQRYRLNAFEIEKARRALRK